MMANNEIIIMPQVRACYVDGQKAVWHKWVDAITVVPENLLNYPYAAGTSMKTVLALVEFPNGSVAQVSTERIQFADGGGFKELAFYPPDILNGGS